LRFSLGIALKPVTFVPQRFVTGLPNVASHPPITYAFFPAICIRADSLTAPYTIFIPKFAELKHFFVFCLKNFSVMFQTAFGDGAMRIAATA
jgi:hypothetical protein